MTEHFGSLVQLVLKSVTVPRKTEIRRKRRMNLLMSMVMIFDDDGDDNFW